ncbi:uncharacterized protein TNCV_16811 [Trichonephila clavipes]|nr:uncharacterized protein TNCV_16811 [Trichonephila clavipes]
MNEERELQCNETAHSADVYRIIGLKEAGSANLGESLAIWVEAIQPLKDADKNGWTVADISVMMIAIDLEPQQIGKTDGLSEQPSQCLIHRYEPSDVRPTLFSDESRSQLRPNDHQRRVWRRPGQCSNPAFTIAHHTGPQPGVMVWVPFLLTAGPLWSSLEEHLQHHTNDASRTF